MANNVVHHDSGAADGTPEQFQIRHRHVRRCAVAATVLGGYVRQDHPHLAHRPPGIAADMMLLAPLLFLRRPGLDDEAAHAVGELLDFFGHP
ncbi:hypothetical protein D3C76_1277280 [compost metagenome]